MNLSLFPRLRRRGQCPGAVHTHPMSGATPGAAIVSSAGYANLAKRPGREPGDFAGSTPAPVNVDALVVKRRSSLASNEKFRVRFLAGVIVTEY